jgi:hypothetical protein
VHIIRARLCCDLRQQRLFSRSLVGHLREVDRLRQVSLTDELLSMKSGLSSGSGISVVFACGLTPRRPA